MPARPADPLPYLLLAAGLRAQGTGLWVGIAAIALGVALGYGVHLINASAVGEFAQAVRTLMGRADVEVRGTRTGFDETLYPRLAALPEVVAVSPVVEVEAVLSLPTAGTHPARPPRGEKEPAAAPRFPKSGESGSVRRTLTLLGVDVFRAAQLQPDLVGRLEVEDDRLRLLDPRAVFLSPAAMAWLNLRPGERLRVQAGLDEVQLEIAGTLPGVGDGLRIGVMDIAAAQWHFDRLGVLHRVDLGLRAGVDPAAFAETLNRLLPAGVRATTAEQGGRQAANVSRAYRVNLNILALVALFTGAFLVFTTQALAVLRRRTRLALLRVLGVTRGGLLRLLLAEGLLQGVIGSLCGLALGYGLAALTLETFGGDLGGGYFSGGTPALRIDPWAWPVFLVLGVGSALLGSLVPASEAAAAAPARAMKAGDEEVSLRKLRPPRLALACLLFAALASLPGPVAGLPLFGYLAVGLLLLGGILLVPWVAHMAFRHAPAGNAVVQLAWLQLAGMPGRAAIALAGIVASFSLMVAMVVMVASFRTSVDDWLARVLPADLYLRAGMAGDSAHFDPQAQQVIAAVRGVERVEFHRSTPLLLDALRPPVILIARPIDVRDPGARLPLVGSVYPVVAGDPPPVWVSEATRDLFGFRLGARMQLPIGGRQVEVLVAGVWRDYARQHGAVVMRAEDYRRLSGDDWVNDAALWLRPGFKMAAVQAELRARLGGAEGAEFSEPGEIRARSLRIFDRSFAVTYLLEVVAVVIGLFGIAVTFASQALARVREFGVLRHLGMRRRQIGVMLALEGGLLAGLGVLMGLVLGWLVALVLIHVINPQSFHWRIDIQLPWPALAGLAAAMLASATVAAVVSGRRAMSVGTVRAVREDW